jgi:hypothetical protein
VGAPEQGRTIEISFGLGVSFGRCDRESVGRPRPPQARNRLPHALHLALVVAGGVRSCEVHVRIDEAVRSTALVLNGSEARGGSETILDNKEVQGARAD